MFSNKMQKKGREKVHFLKWYCRTWFIYNFLTGYKNRLQLPALPLKKKRATGRAESCCLLLLLMYHSVQNIYRPP